MRGSYGTGSIGYHRGRKKWRVRIWFEGKEIFGGYHDTEDAAKLALAALQEQLAELQPTVPGTTVLSLRAWGKTWLDARELDGYHRDLKSDRSRWKARVVGMAHFIDHPIDGITSQDIREWVALQLKTPSKKTGKPTNKQTIQNALNLLRVCLEEATQKNLIPSNPAREVLIPRGASATTDVPWDWLRQDEIDALLRHAKTKQRSIFAMAIFTGLRAGELFGLRWGAIDLDRGLITVKVAYKDQPIKTGKPKHVPLLPQAREYLLEWKARCKHTATDDLVWRAKDGAPHRKSYQAGLPKALEKAGVTRAIRFHDLKHTCASHLLQGTWGRMWSIEEVCGFLHHSNITVTQRYAHLCPTGLLAAAQCTTGPSPVSPSVPSTGPGPGQTGSETDGESRNPSESGAANRTRTGDLRFTKTRNCSLKSSPYEGSTSVGPVCRDALTQLTEGNFPEKELEFIATQILGRPEIQAALKYLEAGPEMKVAHAISLCATLLAQERRGRVAEGA